MSDDSPNLATHQQPSLSFFKIEQELAELMTFAAGENLTEEERLAVDIQIESYVKRELRKVDGLRAYVRYCEAQAHAAVIARQEMERLLAWERMWLGRIDKLKGYIRKIYQVFGIKGRLEGAHGYIAVQKAGGIQALTVVDLSVLPSDCKQLQITVRLKDWEKLAAAMALSQEGARALSNFTSSLLKGVQVADTDAIRKILDQPCARCNGLGIIAGPTPPHPLMGEQSLQCSICQGDGKRRMEGVHLEPRGYSVIVK